MRDPDETISDLLRFHFDRLPKTEQPYRGRPCLSENWFVEDLRPIAPNWISDDHLRKLWRVARLQRLGLYHGPGCPFLLYHQMVELMEILFRVALDQYKAPG